VTFVQAVSVVMIVAATMGCHRVHAISDSQPCGVHVQLPPGERFARPAFKGVELYSWISTSGDFRFALLWGTNREKAVEEIKGASSCTLADVAAVKARLSRLARGEQVSWLHRASTHGSSFAYPPSDVVEAVRRHCATLGIEFYVPSLDDRGQ
jgi:hypothetical protein